MRCMFFLQLFQRCEVVLWSIFYRPWTMIQHSTSFFRWVHIYNLFFSRRQRVNRKSLKNPKITVASSHFNVFNEFFMIFYFTLMGMSQNVKFLDQASLIKALIFVFSENWSLWWKNYLAIIMKFKTLFFPFFHLIRWHYQTNVPK